MTNTAGARDTDRRPELVDLNLPTIALVGRVNVGKSMLFNRIMETHQAIVSPVAGTTRTRNMGVFTWRGVQTRLIDAGGLTFRKDEVYEDTVHAQTVRAIAEASVILFVVDIVAGLMPHDREIAKLLHTTHKPIFLVANKADAPRLHTLVHEAEWLKLGYGTPRAVSAVNGVGIGDVLDELFAQFHKRGVRPKRLTIKPTIRVAIVGKPNVGKSTLLNQIIGEEYVITSPHAHTTRETFRVLMKWHNEFLEFIDTAGIRRKARVSAGLERIGVVQSIKHMHDADVVLLMIDATDPASTQEKSLAQLIATKRRSVVFVVNKWDMIDDHSEENRKTFLASLHDYYPHLVHAGTIFISAKTGFRVHQLYDLIMEAFAARHLQLDAHTLDEFLRMLIARHKPTRGKGTRYPRILGLKQLDTDPPQFQLTVKARTSVHPSYLKFVERALREKFGFVGTPIVLYTKKTKV